MADWNGILNFDMNDPKTAGLLNLGLGILMGNTGRPGDLGQGLLGGMQNYQNMMAQQQRQKMLDQQQQMQQEQFDMQKTEYQRKLDAETKQKDALSRLLSGQQGYITQQDTPVSRDVYAPIPAAVGAQAPNFGMAKETVTENVKAPVFNNAGYMQDLIDAGYGGKLIEQQFAKKDPIKLGKGESLYDPSTYQPLVQAAQSEDLPSAVQEYQFAVKQGYRGSFRDWVTEKARSGASNTTVSYGAPVAGVDANGNPVFFQPDKSGGAPAIVPGVRPKPDQPKAPTEIQAKAGTFHSQMVSASNELGTLAREGFDPSKVRAQVETSVAGGITNPVAGEKAQRARQAQEQWSEAFLRVKTGAAATQGEVDRNIRTFFPQIGDTPEVIAQKARMRKQAEADVASMAGPAQQSTTTQPSSADLQELARQELKRRGKGK
jgi:type II secretory pathway pseudopilin PulG